MPRRRCTLAKGIASIGVFTKLAAWTLTEYEKVLLLDIDVIHLRLPDELFQLEPPAALVRGPYGVEQPGSEVDGRRFFVGTYLKMQTREIMLGARAAESMLVLFCYDHARRLLSKCSQK